MFYRPFYKPRFIGYYYVRSFVQIVDALLTMIVAPFGLESTWYGDFCEWNCRKDLERRRNSSLMLNSLRT